MVCLCSSSLELAEDGEERSCCGHRKVEKNGFVVNVFCLVSFYYFWGFGVVISSGCLEVVCGVSPEKEVNEWGF